MKFKSVFSVIPRIILILPNIISGQIGIDDNIRLVDGETPFEGRVEIFKDGSWASVCSDDWNMNVADILCINHGISKGAMSLWEDPPRGSHSTVTGGSFHCTGSQVILSECFKPWSTADERRDTCQPIGVRCNLPGYVGCVPLNKEHRSSTSCRHGDDLGRGRKCNVSIAGCVEFCQYPLFNYAGLVHGNECHCIESTSAFTGRGRITNSNCDAPCVGKEGEICGGSDYISVYSSSVGSCGGLFSGDVVQGAIVSPGFPGNYPSNIDCTWIIAQPAGTKVELTLTMLHLADPDDVIHIIETLVSSGESVTTILQGSQTALQFPRKLTTRSNAVRVVFRSNNARQDKGFIFQFKAIDESSIENPSEMVTESTIESGREDGSSAPGTKKHFSVHIDTGIAIGISLSLILVVAAVTLLIILIRKRRIDKQSETGVDVYNVTEETQNSTGNQTGQSPNGVTEGLYAEIREGTRSPRNAGNGNTVQRPALNIAPKYYTLEETANDTDNMGNVAGYNGAIPVHTHGRDQHGRNAGMLKPMYQRDSVSDHDMTKAEQRGYIRSMHIYEEIPYDVDIDTENPRQDVCESVTLPLYANADIVRTNKRQHRVSSSVKNYDQSDQGQMTIELNRQPNNHDHTTDRSRGGFYSSQDGHSYRTHHDRDLTRAPIT